MEAWKTTLSVLYNRLRIGSDCRARIPADFDLFLEGQLRPTDGMGVSIPLSGEALAWIEPLCDKLSPEMEIRYELMGQTQSDFTAYTWRKDHELTERETYTQYAKDAVEFYETAIQSTITELRVSGIDVNA